MEEDKKKIDNLTNRDNSDSKLSTDKLICKSSQESVNSIKSDKNHLNSVLYFGLLQFFLGILMLTFGVSVILYNSSLSHLGAGIWAGSLAITTGITGVLTGANKSCPLKTTPLKIMHTTFLALSLTSFAMSQLVVALAATGLGRDISKADTTEDLEVEATTTMSPPGRISITLPSNYLAILFDIGLLIVSSLECILAAIASYKSARMLCSCFRQDNNELNDNFVINNRHALVRSWLMGKHGPGPLYVVTTPSLSSHKGSKISTTLPITPIFTIPPPAPPGYPLIPAPLGTIPSPVIPPPPRKIIPKLRKFPIVMRETTPKRHPKDEKVVTNEDIVRTYTGIDKIMAEEYIDMCDSRNVSLCSDSSFNSICQSPSGNNSNSDAASREYLVNKG